MDILTPITREEMLMNDEPLTPITREEKILAGEDLNPVTRREYFLKKYRHAGGDVMVEGLEVTANGTYTAPEGKAYSPVEVAVPLPENAYLLKTASGSLVSFSDGADLPMPSFICNIDAVQDLHGYDAPWVGGAGKNKFDSNSELYLGFGTISVDESGSFSSGDYKASVIPINGNDYVLSGLNFNAVTDDVIRLFLCNDYPAVGVNCSRIYNLYSNKSFRITANYNYLVILYRWKNTATETDKNSAQIENGTTATSYAPYSNICPISGHTGVDAWVKGKNLCPVILSGDASNKGYTATVENDGIIIVTGTWTGTSNSVIGINEQVRFNLPAGSYILSGATIDNYNDYGVCLQIYNWNTSRAIVNTSTTEDAEFTLEAQTEISVRIFIYNSKASGKTIPSGGIKLYPMIRLATETDSTFEPYNPNSQTIQVSWQTEAGEVFGGYVDLASGVLTVTHKSQTGFTRGSQDSSNKLYNIGAISDMKSSNNVNVTDNYFEPLNINDARTSETPSITQYGTNLYVGGYIGKATELDTLLETLQVKYELETPITYQLTPTQIKSLRGNNNAWCSTGDADIDYFAKEV